MKAYQIDGAEFETLEQFYDEVSRVLIPNVQWGRNLNAFNDILRGGFGTPDEGFRLIWLASDLSRVKLGYAETARQLEKSLETCHPTARGEVTQQLRDARSGIGPTVFDWLVEIIRFHGEGGAEAEDNVVLDLR